MPSKFFLTFFLLPLILFSYYGFEEPWGKDAEVFLNEKKVNETKDLSLISKVADKIITFKQRVISPVDGPRSHFRPTSSRYMQLAIYRYGFLKGFLMGCDRLLRENDEKWIYRTIVIDGIEYKYDPAINDKFQIPNLNLAKKR